MIEHERIVINIDATSASTKLDELQRKIDRLNAALGGAPAAPGGGAPAGGPAPYNPAAMGNAARLNPRWSVDRQRAQEERELAREERERIRAERDAARAAARAARDKERDDRNRARDEERKARRLDAAKSAATRKVVQGLAAIGAGTVGTASSAMAGNPAGLGVGIGTAMGGVGRAMQGAAERGAASHGDNGLFTSMNIMGGGILLGGTLMSGLGFLAGQRYSLANKIADTQKAGLYATLSGGSPVYAAKGDAGSDGEGWAQLGMGPQEAAAQQSMANLAAGYAGSMSGVNIPKALSQGMSAGALGNLAGTVGLGKTGGSGAVLTENTIAAGVRQGFSGSQLERWAGTVTNAVARSAMSGVKIDTNNYSRMLNGMSAAGGKSGMDAANVLSNVSNLPAQAKQSITGQFSGVARALTLAHAAKGADGIGGLMRNLENMSPEDTMKALRSGGMASQLYLSGMTQFDTAGAFLGAEPQGGGYGEGVSVGGAAAVRARNAFRLQDTMDSKTAAQFITAVTDLQVAMHKLMDKMNFDKLFITIADTLKKLAALF